MPENEATRPYGRVLVSKMLEYRGWQFTSYQIIFGVRKADCGTHRLNIPNGQIASKGTDTNQTHFNTDEGLTEDGV